MPIQEIPARAGRAVRVAAGQALKIINTHGTQVVDFWAISARDPKVHVSMVHTRSKLSRLTPRAGDQLFDNFREPMLAFESDTSPGVHDTVIAPCDPARYAQLGAPPDHASCATNLHRALAALDIEVPECPDSFNLWMNIPVTAAQDLEWRQTVSKPGDSVVFRALVDCVMVMSACPQDIICINSHTPTSAHYELLAD
jgi:uncharacterized protein